MQHSQLILVLIVACILHTVVSFGGLTPPISVCPATSPICPGMCSNEPQPSLPGDIVSTVFTSGYVPGETYVITFTATAPLEWRGFLMSIYDPDDSTEHGTFIADDAKFDTTGVALVDGCRNSIRHRNRFDVSDARSFTWTAPATNVGTLTAQAWVMFRRPSSAQCMWKNIVRVIAQAQVTASPTNAPVAPPTLPPTNAPVPVLTPTNAPFPPPTQPPTNAPVPVLTPTNAPFPPPTQPPTNAPVPVLTPTNAPFPPPTQPPTNAPVPVVVPPTNAPFPPPTQAPTNAPVPVLTPTNAPFPPPTQPPTNAPVPPPTQPPTNAPVQTAAPTNAPFTTAPTNAPFPPPTEPPTNAPVPQPTNSPTNAPVQLTPTNAPFAPPTNSPTNAPVVVSPVSGCSAFTLAGGVFPTGQYVLGDASGPPAPPSYCMRLDNAGRRPTTVTCIERNMRVTFDPVARTIMVAGHIVGGVDIGATRDSNTVGSVNIIFNNVNVVGTAPNWELTSDSIREGIIFFNNQVFLVTAERLQQAIRVFETAPGSGSFNMFGLFRRFQSTVTISDPTRISATVGECIE